MTTSVTHARKPALALCLFVCGNLTHTPSAFLNPNVNVALTRATADISTALSSTQSSSRRQQQHRQQRPSMARRAPRRRPSSCGAGGLRLSAVEDDWEEGEDDKDTSGIYVATEVRKNVPCDTHQSTQHTHANVGEFKLTSRNLQQSYCCSALLFTGGTSTVLAQRGYRGRRTVGIRHPTCVTAVVRTHEIFIVPRQLL